jgi:transcriptional regulator with XRE-family HTH domain
LLHAEQIRAARGLLGWNQAELANRAGVSPMTIKRLEAQSGVVGGTVDTVLRVQKALEKAGIVFIASNTEGGPGVRLLKRSSARKK